MKKVLLNKLQKVFDRYDEIKLVYFFGSKAENTDGPLSDYDLAFYLDERDAKKIYDIKFKLFDEISRILKTDKLDIVMLDTVKAPELKYDIIKTGRLIYEKEPYKVLFEPKALNEYFDFMIMLRGHLKTQVFYCPPKAIQRNGKLGKLSFKFRRKTIHQSSQYVQYSSSFFIVFHSKFETFVTKMSFQMTS